MHRGAVLAAVVLLGFFLLPGCSSTTEAYFARVDRVEPAIPGLLVEGTRGVYGELLITNNTGYDVYLYDQEGQEQFKITATESFRKDDQENWVPWGSGNWIAYHERVIEYGGANSSFHQPSGSYPGETMREWIISGRAGDTPFKIYGRTVYQPIK